MYQSHVEGRSLFEVVSSGYGEPITSFGLVEHGETPVSLLNIALASCVTMCVQGYFAKVQHRNDVKVVVDSQLDFEKKSVVLFLDLDVQLTEEVKDDLANYIEEKCKVKQLLREDLAVTWSYI